MEKDKRGEIIRVKKAIELSDTRVLSESSLSDTRVIVRW